MTDQAGAIAVRRRESIPQVMIVRAKKNPEHWIFPKGHIERGETPAEAAVRELREEAGVVGDPLKSLGVSTFRSGREDVRVTYFLARYRDTAPDAERETRWATIAEARRLLTFDDARDLLDAVEHALQEGAL